MSKVLRWVGIILGGLVGLVVVAYGALYVVTEQSMNKTYDFPVEPVAVPTDEAARARGGHLVNTVGFCTECHGPDLGGQAMVDDLITGRLIAPNLTSGQGGAASTLTDEEFVRAIRHGVGQDGRSLIVMPAYLFYNLSDADLGAIIAYIRGLPPVDKEWQPTAIGPMGRFYVWQDPTSLPASLIDHTGPRPAAPEPGVTAEYGEYLAFNCRTCHGEDLGGQPEAMGGGSNLTPGGEVGDWTVEEFIQTIRTRVKPNGEEIDPELAPLFKTIGQLTDDELTAIYLYIQSVPLVESTPQP
jgi:mono/diheme cytochrome c family protein